MKEEMSDFAQEILIENVTACEEGDIVFVDECEHIHIKKDNDNFLVILDKINMLAVNLENFAMLTVYRMDNQESKICELFNEVITLPNELYIYKAGKVCKDLLEEYKENYIKFLEKHK